MGERMKRKGLRGNSVCVSHSPRKAEFTALGSQGGPGSRELLGCPLTVGKQRRLRAQPQGAGVRALWELTDGGGGSLLPFSPHSILS